MKLIQIWFEFKRSCRQSLVRSLNIQEFIDDDERIGKQINTYHTILHSLLNGSIWQNSVVQWVHPLVGRVYALPHVVISLFRDSDFEDLATGLLLSLGPTCGTLFRPKLDNRVTIYYSSRVNWKHFCSSSPEPFCGSISNEGPHKYSILLLLQLFIFFV